MIVWRFFPETNKADDAAQMTSGDSMTNRNSILDYVVTM
jgi:hypothetical protein